LVAGQHRAATTLEDLQPFPQPGRKLPQTEVDPSGRKLDRKGNSVELPADLGDEGGILVVQLELFVARRHPIDE
jgi:hypothetical protein